MELDMTKFYTIQQTEIETDPEAVLDKCTHGYSPILIRGNDGNDVLLLSWSDHCNRFGCLYTEEELKEIENLCRNSDDVCDALIKNRW